MSKNIILIIDDCPIYQTTLQNLVAQSGFTTESCTDGMQAMIRTNSNMENVAAVLLDIYMPEIDGISLLGHLRNKYPALPVYVISGSEDPDDKTGVLALGAKQYIAKPLDGEAAAALVKTLQELG